MNRSNHVDGARDPEDAELLVRCVCCWQACVPPSPARSSSGRPGGSVDSERRRHVVHIGRLASCCQPERWQRLLSCRWLLARVERVLPPPPPPQSPHNTTAPAQLRVVLLAPVATTVDASDRPLLRCVFHGRRWARVLASAVSGDCVMAIRGGGARLWHSCPPELVDGLLGVSLHIGCVGPVAPDVARDTTAAATARVIVYHLEASAGIKCERHPSSRAAAAAAAPAITTSPAAVGGVRSSTSSPERACAAEADAEAAAVSSANTDARLSSASAVVGSDASSQPRPAAEVDGTAAQQQFAGLSSTQLAAREPSVGHVHYTSVRQLLSGTCDAARVHVMAVASGVVRTRAAGRPALLLCDPSHVPSQSASNSITSSSCGGGGAGRDVAHHRDGFLVVLVCSAAESEPLLATEPPPSSQQSALIGSVVRVRHVKLERYGDRVTGRVFHMAQLSVFSGRPGAELDNQLEEQRRRRPLQLTAGEQLRVHWLRAWWTAVKKEAQAAAAAAEEVVFNHAATVDSTTCCDSGSPATVAAVAATDMTMCSTVSLELSTDDDDDRLAGGLDDDDDDEACDGAVVAVKRIKLRDHSATATSSVRVEPTPNKKRARCSDGQTQIQANVSGGLQTRDCHSSVNVSESIEDIRQFLTATNGNGSSQTQQPTMDTIDDVIDDVSEVDVFNAGLLHSPDSHASAIGESNAGNQHSPSIDTQMERAALSCYPFHGESLPPAMSQCSDTSAACSPPPSVSECVTPSLSPAPARAESMCLTPAAIDTTISTSSTQFAEATAANDDVTAGQTIIDDVSSSDVITGRVCLSALTGTSGETDGLWTTAARALCNTCSLSVAGDGVERLLRVRRPQQRPIAVCPGCDSRMALSLCVPIIVRCRGENRAPSVGAISNNDGEPTSVEWRSVNAVLDTASCLQPADSVVALTAIQRLISELLANPSTDGGDIYRMNVQSQSNGTVCVVGLERVEE